MLSNFTAIKCSLLLCLVLFVFCIWNGGWMDRQALYLFIYSYKIINPNKQVLPQAEYEAEVSGSVTLWSCSYELACRCIFSEMVWRYVDHCHFISQKLIPSVSFVIKWLSVPDQRTLSASVEWVDREESLLGYHSCCLKSAMYEMVLLFKVILDNSLERSLINCITDAEPTVWQQN